MEHGASPLPNVDTGRTSTTPQSIDRSNAAQFSAVSETGSAKVRETTIASGVAACWIADRRRCKYLGGAPSPILESANASNDERGALSRKSAASAQTNWIGVTGGSGSVSGCPNSRAAAYGLDRFGWLAQQRRSRRRTCLPNSRGNDATNGPA